MSEMRVAFVDNLVRVNRKMRTLFDARAKELGLTQSRARLLLALAQDEGMTQTRLAAVLDIEKPSLVGLLDGLEKLGSISRQADVEDRRTKRVYLTDQARLEAAGLLAFSTGLRQQILEGIPDEELSVASRALAQVFHNITGASGEASS